MALSTPLSVLDLVPAHAGRAPREAFRDALTLARACEAAGYTRFWISEHHGMQAYVCPAPVVLIAHIAAQTERMRIGSGGVMLCNYSPLHVAESFRVLADLHPARVDLGIGSAPGGDARSAEALAAPAGTGGAARQRYADQARDLLGFLKGQLPASHRFADVRVLPDCPTPPEPFMLCRSEDSARLAGALGYNLALGLFTGGGDPSPACVRAYREACGDRRGHAVLAVAVVCAEDGARARALATTGALWAAQVAVTGDFGHGLVDPSEIDAGALSATGRAVFDAILRDAVLGTPGECRAQLERLREQYGADELMIVTSTHDFDARVRSYELLARAFAC